MKRLVELIKKIQFNEAQNENIFWAPRIISKYNRKYPGCTLYAYGGAVMSLYQVDDDKYSGDPFDDTYYKYFKNEKEGETIRKDFEDKIKHGIDFLETWDYWDDVLCAVNGKKQNDERRRENRIACNNSACGYMYEVFDMEANTKINEPDKKFDAKADMMWLRFVGEKPVISFVEYKCTNTVRRNPESSLSRHFHKMVNYYDRQDVKNTVLSLLKRKRMLNDEPEVTFEDFDTEIVFLFSHMNPTRKSKYDPQSKYTNGITEGNIKRGLREMYKDNEEKIKENKGKIRIAFIDDEDSRLETMVSTTEIDFSSENAIWDSIYVRPMREIQ